MTYTVMYSLIREREGEREGGGGQPPKISKLCDFGRAEKKKTNLTIR
jgi:hypothetical protein